jgi:hypothetical protein
MQLAESQNFTRSIPATAIESLEDAVVVVALALDVAGHSRDYIAGAIAAERLHGCLRSGAPLWIHKAGAASYRRAAEANPPSAPVRTPAAT